MPRADRRRGRDRGFTLLEILAAVAILAVAVISIYSLQNQTIGLSSLHNEMIIAVMVAREKVAEAEIKAKYPNLMMPGKALQEVYPTFETEEPSPDTSGALTSLPAGMVPRQMGTTVKWTHGGRPREYTLRSYFPVQ